MDEFERHRLRRVARQAALKRLGVRNVRCVCGETDPLCFEAEHINRRKYDDVVWGCCINCHRKKSARERAEHPTVGLHPGDPFERMAHRFLGAAVYLEFCVEGLRQDAEVMFKLAGREFKIED
jgi:hypothetical protein